MSQDDKTWASLNLQTQQRLLGACGAPQGPIPPHTFDLHLTSVARKKLEEALEVIRILSDPSADAWVRYGMEVRNWDVAKIQSMASNADRIARIWVEDSSLALKLASWQDANISVRCDTRTDVFRFPKADVAQAFSSGEHGRLKGRIERVLKDCLQIAPILDLRVTNRSSPWKGDQKHQVVQIDLKYANHSESIEVERGKTTKKLSLRRVSDAVILVDPARETISVSTQENARRRLRTKLADAVLQHCQGEDAVPKAIEPILIHLQRLRRKPNFPLRTDDLVVDARVHEIAYRILGEAGVQYVRTAEAASADIYSSRTATVPESVDVFRARIALSFQRSDGRRARHHVTLQTPSSVSYGRMPPDLQDAAEQMLSRMGLIDPDPSKGADTQFAVLENLQSGDFELAIGKLMDAEWITALKAEGILVPDRIDQQATGYCQRCGCPHDLVVNKFGGSETLLACPSNPIPANDLMRSRLRFSAVALAGYIAQKLGTDVRHPHESPTGVFKLGKQRGQGSRAEVNLMLACQLHKSEHLKSLQRNIEDSGPKSTGLALVLSNRALGLRLPFNWKTVLITSVLSIESEKLVIDPEAPASILVGRAIKKSLAPKDRQAQWASLYEAYSKEVRPDKLNAEQAAAKLFKLHPGKWAWKPNTVAKKLREKFPEDFGG